MQNIVRYLVPGTLPDLLDTTSPPYYQLHENNVSAVQIRTLQYDRTTQL